MNATLAMICVFLAIALLALVVATLRAAWRRFTSDKPLYRATDESRIERETRALLRQANRGTR